MGPLRFREAAVGRHVSGSVGGVRGAAGKLSLFRGGSSRFGPFYPRAVASHPGSGSGTASSKPPDGRSGAPPLSLPPPVFVVGVTLEGFWSVCSLSPVPRPAGLPRSLEHPPPSHTHKYTPPGVFNTVIPTPPLPTTIKGLNLTLTFPFFFFFFLKGGVVFFCFLFFAWSP